MATPIVLRSRQQILGDLVRTLLAETDLTDVAPGSDLATLLEATATSQAQIEASALKILESTDLESLTGDRLERKAQSLKIPNGIGGVGKKPASQASGMVQIGSSFTKISSKMYNGKPAPYAGATVMYLENAASFPATGSVYIARGTVDRFEGPVPYTSVVNSGSFWTITLSSPLTKSHLQSDLVVLAQGGDRLVAAGTTVQVPSSSQAPTVSFTTSIDLVIPDGEDTGMVPVICTQFGEVGNALAGSIVQFSTSPFTGATVTNPSSFVSGKSTESDEDLRQRIRNYPSTLSRGTVSAILGAIIGASDESGRTIQSAVVLSPVSPGDFARAFIDDGTGLEPTFGVQPYELLLQSSSGQETRFRTAQFPVTPAVIEGTNQAPYDLSAAQFGPLTIQVTVDEISETYTITPSNYQNLSSATAYEVVRDLNSQSNIVGFRTVDGGSRIVMIDLSGDSEVLNVDSGILQGIFGFPVYKIRPIFLYKNSELLSFRGKTATLTTRSRAAWTLTPTDLQNIRVVVDGVTQTFTVTDADFASFGTNITTSTVVQWASVLAKKIAGVKFTVSGDLLLWSTYQTFSAGGSLEILSTRADGTSSNWVSSTGMWDPADALSSSGSSKDFDFNRFTGEISLISKPAVGSKIEVGSQSTRAHIRTTEAPSGQVDLSPSPSTVGNSRLILAFDGDFAIRTKTVPTGVTVTATHPDPSGAKNILRLTATDNGLFRTAEVDDWFYISHDASASPASLPASVARPYRIKTLGYNLYPTNQTYVGLTGATLVDAAQSITTTPDSNIVKVTKTAHGLKTGDLITTTASSTVGGILAAQLTVTDSPIVVLDDNNYTYVAGSVATSSASGTLDTVGYNLITVTHASHGFSSGAWINTVVSSGFGGISAGNLSTTNNEIEVINLNTYKFRAAAAATSTTTGQTLNQVIYLADCWVEFEVSDAEFAVWSPLLTIAKGITSQSFAVFKTTAIPQVVDFGASSSLTIDQIVTYINDRIVSGSAVKITPQVIEIRSNDFATGTCAVLASIGNANNLTEPSVQESIQPHTAYSQSKDTSSGLPVVSQVVLQTAPSAGYPTRTYMKVDKTFTNVLDEAINPAINAPTALVPTYPVGFEHLFVTGRNANLKSRVYNNQVSTPFTGIASGVNVLDIVGTQDSTQTSPDTLDRYSNFGLRLQDTPLGAHDKLVVEMDLNPTDKLVSISMFKKAKIQDIDPVAGTGKGQVISFRLKDSEDADKPFFDSSSVYKTYDFRDFKLLTKSVGLYREDVSDRALVLRSVEYGAPARLSLSVRLPESPDLDDISVTHVNDYKNGYARNVLIVSLASESLLAGSTLATGVYKVSSTASGTLFDWRITSGSLNNTSVYTPNDVLNISGASSLSGSYVITAADYKNYSSPSASTNGTNYAGLSVATNGTSYAGLSASVTNGSAIVTVTQPGHGFTSGQTVSVTTSTAIGGISAVNLTTVGSVITVLNANTYTYTAAAVASSNAVGTLDTVFRGNTLITVTHTAHGFTSGDFITVTASSPIGGISAANLSVTAAITVVNANTYTYNAAADSSSIAGGTVTNIFKGSRTVTVLQTAHGFQTGDLATITGAGTIGGITPLQLSVVDTPVTFISANQFSYEANGFASTLSSGSLATVTGGAVTVKTPGSGGLAPSALYSAAQSPIRSWKLLDKTWPEMATAINAYLPDNQVAAAVAIGSSFASNPIAKPTYTVYPASSAYSGSDMNGAFNWHVFDTHRSGSAGIWQYDSSNPSLNNIKATVQTDESIFPTTTEASGTSYSPIDEEVLIVPTNTKTISSWMAFKATSSLNILASIERIKSDSVVQISSRSLGSLGAVHVTGVSANSVDSAVIGNAVTDGNSSKATILSADAKPLFSGQLVKLANSINSEILFAYRTAPSGASVTVANTNDIVNYFRPTNAIKYIKINANTGRLIFLRNGLGPSQTEPLAIGNSIQFTNLGSGLVQVTSTGGVLSARVGDQMYIQPTSNFPVDAKCYPLGITGTRETNSSTPEYLGYPVAHVIDANNIVIIAPNITTFTTTVLAHARDLVFMPAIWNEKNIKTNHQSGAKFRSLVPGGKSNYLVKTLGNGLVSLWILNSATELTDTAQLDVMSVNTDDYISITGGVAQENTGKFRIVAHNGRNQVIYYNPNGGKDELVDANLYENGGRGSRKWKVDGLKDGVNRSVRIISGDSVQIGDFIRISAPSDNSSQWFNSVFFGSWAITGIGYQAVDYTGVPFNPTPHNQTSGVADPYYITPYIDFTIPNAPAAIQDNSSLNVDKFLIGNNVSSIGFTEGTPWEVYRMVVGHSVNPISSENSDIFLAPEYNTQKISDVFRTALSAQGKIGFSTNIFQGIDGYKLYTGLVQEAHRIIDGLPDNQILYPGVKAAGATIEVQTPLIKSIKMNLQVRPKDGVDLNSITDLVKATVSSYINGLGTGKPVVLSEVIKEVQSLPGVFSVTILSTLPVPFDDRIVSAETEKPYILSIDDVTVG